MKNTEGKELRKERKKSGFPLRKATIAAAAVLLAISIALLVATARVTMVYRQINRTMDEYLRWQSMAGEMRDVSDTITQEARAFASTGDRAYMDAYFTEIKQTRSREKLLEAFYDEFNGLSPYEALEQALEESNVLMEREFYSMRLKAEAMGADLNLYPAEVVGVVLTDEDRALSAEEKAERALVVLYDDQYTEKKNSIYAKTNDCLDDLAAIVSERQTESVNLLWKLLIQQIVFVVCLLVIVFAFFAINAFFVYKPLMRATERIQSDEQLDVGALGAYELKFLAEAYNEVLRKNLENKASLQYKATHDPLTKVRNRSGLDKTMAKADRTNAAVLILDVDDYKTVNDRYGHAVGDRILQFIAQELMRVFPDTYIARIGGDEFCLLLKGETEDLAAFTESIREKIDGINDVLQHSDDLPAVSVSCGVGFCAECEGREAMRAADRALYRMKRSGKNGCCFDGEERDDI